MSERVGEKDLEREREDRESKSTREIKREEGRGRARDSE